MEQAVITSACRTAIGEFMGTLAPKKATELGAIAIKEAVKRAGIDPDLIDEVIMGQVVQAGAGQAPARQASIHAGIPPKAGAMTINKVCGSGLKAVMLAAQAVKLGDAEIIVAGGMESMSNCPFLLQNLRNGVKFGNQPLIDSMIEDGLTDSFGRVHMGVLAEGTAEKWGISREDQDQYALESHQKAVKAQDTGKFDAEITPVEIPRRRKDPIIFTKDERPRADTTLKVLSRLRPAFKKNGSVTAGSAPGLNDGGSAVMVTSASKALELGVTPLVKIIDYATGGINPKDLFEAPIVAVKKLMARMKVNIEYFDLIEANEAFAVQCLADGKGLGWDWDRVNVHGGAIALGHPIGASGARVLTTLIYAMKNRGARTGLATLCLGGGNAVAMAVEAV
ncbi:MAG: acetyl-CoA acetyltransferase [Candidatus Cloacimonetes bacterium 4572_55]|nr:MAG: acetyl-CoA acetyltransferase [Candidatus Cloacimonetes bacterium 4572_55]